MQNLVPYSTLTGSGYGNGPYVQVVEPHLHNLLRKLIPTIHFDEAWYKKRYSDIAEAVETGQLQSAHEHYVAVGYFENRFPRFVVADSKWYLETYPDVADAVQRGKFVDAQEHFEKDGFREGRLPFSGWNL